MILVGAALDHIPGPKYAEQLRFAELTLRAPLPRAATLRRQRHEAPEGLVLGLRAPRSAISSARGPLRFDDALERGVAWLFAASDALSARAVVLPTPADLAPGARDRELLAAFAARLPRTSERLWVWEPSGAWEREQAEQLARELGLLLAFDPLLEPRPGGPDCYARLRALGARRGFSHAALEQALAVVDGAAEAEDDGASAHADTLSLIAVDAPAAVKHAVALQQLLETNRSNGA